MLTCSQETKGLIYKAGLPITGFSHSVLEIHSDYIVTYVI